MTGRIEISAIKDTLDLLSGDEEDVFRTIALEEIWQEVKPKEEDGET